MADLTKAPESLFDAMGPDELLDNLIGIRLAIAGLKGQDEAILDRLTELYDAGELDASFTHDDWAFSFSEGRRKWTYPDNITDLEAGVKAAKKAAEADGSATASRGASFWTVKEPRP